MRTEYLAKVKIDGVEMCAVHPDKQSAGDWLAKTMAEAAKYKLPLSGAMIEAPRYISDITGKEMISCKSTRSRPEPVTNRPTR